ncbi:MAG: DUF1800 family protein [Cytophagales bacterium]
MAISKRSGVLSRKAAAHLLRRTCWGFTSADLADFTGISVDAAMNKLYKSVASPSAPIAPNETTSWTSTAPVDGEDDGAYQAFLKKWWLGVILGTDISQADKLSFSAKEKIVFFLHTVFTTIQETVNSSRALYFQLELFRKYALDADESDTINIKELTKKICIDNAMLNLLDGKQNIKSKPNENYARELLELYSIGKGLSGEVPATSAEGDYYYYTESDVQQAARVLTGWDFDNTFATLDADTSLPRGKIKSNLLGVPTQHDLGIKTFSSRFGSKSVTPDTSLYSNNNATEASMLDEISQLVEIIYQNDETAKNICRKIYRFFVHHDIDENLDSTFIADMVSTFKANNYKIQPVIEEVLSSAHFYEVADSSVSNDKFGAIIKSPLDLMAQTLRMFAYELPSYSTDKENFYAKTGTLLNDLFEQGLNFLNPYDVAGYEAYHQFPLFNRMWINTNALTKRYQFIYKTLQTEKQEPEDISIDVVTFVENHYETEVINNADDLVRAVAADFFSLYDETTEITTVRFNWFKSELLKIGENYPDGAELYWQIKWAGRNNSEANMSDARGMLQDLFNAILQSPEYQLM